MDATTAIRKLTPAQRRILASLPDDGTFADAYYVCKQRNTRMALNNLGVTEPKRNGPITEWRLFRPTELGKEVRKELRRLRLV